MIIYIYSPKCIITKLSEIYELYCKKNYYIGLLVFIAHKYKIIHVLYLFL